MFSASSGARTSKSAQAQYSATCVSINSPCFRTEVVSSSLYVCQASSRLGETGEKCDVGNGARAMMRRATLSSRWRRATTAGPNLEATGSVSATRTLSGRAAGDEVIESLWRGEQRGWWKCVTSDLRHGIVLHCTLDRHWPPPHRLRCTVCTRRRTLTATATVTVTAHHFICWPGRVEGACGILTCRHANEPRRRLLSVGV